MADDIAPVMPPPSGPAMPPQSRDPKATARDFEAVFIGQMTKIMMESARPANGYEGGHGEEMFQGILAEELGKAVAQRGGIGIAPAVLNQIIRMQGGNPGGR